ncbi:hypothetical protein HJG60_007486 [Phyllostomus discolor]|uniref:Leukocyte-associated immunoglobulin-like receptor 1 n=1 Tax=Phyllostomus discolor TaxID=89673 RepID=A0A834DET2_9CHIR|nr:hypothetical protein HJG60_007486 [Phyllostomus discolor]
MWLVQRRPWLLQFFNFNISGFNNTRLPIWTGLTYGISIPTESSTSRAALEGTVLSPELLYILVGICVASLLCLLLLAFLLVHCQRQKKCGPPSSKGEEPRPQERLSPTGDLTESPADVATTVDALPEENEDMHSPSTAEGDPQEVTYAQLDQWALTRRAAHTETPQPMEPTAESSVYADLSRH